MAGQDPLKGGMLSARALVGIRIVPHRCRGRDGCAVPRIHLCRPSGDRVHEFPAGPLSLPCVSAMGVASQG
jgi:hypothetical protein